MTIAAVRVVPHYGRLAESVPDCVEVIVRSCGHRVRDRIGGCR